MNLTLIDKAHKLRGAFADRKCVTGRRRYNMNGDCFLPEDPFLADEIKIINSKAWRRLHRKTQVTSFPINHHIRDRASHSGEVSAIAVTIADALGLNANLVRAIAQGHDTGHVPLGHPGEEYLAQTTGRKFTHEVMGVFVAQNVERKGLGLNLTFEVLDGMMRHSGKNVSPTMTLEAWVVRFADKIAFLFSDYNDFKRFGFRFNPELVRLMERFGDNQRERVATAVSALIVESVEKGRVDFSESEFGKDFSKIRELMYEAYPRVTAQDPKRVMAHIFDFVAGLKMGDPLLILALMTDTDIEYLDRQSMLNVSHIRQTSAGELLDNLPEKDCCDPDLNW